MATLTERLAIVVDANTGKAVAEFKQLGTATKGLSGPIGETSGLLGKLGGQFGQLGGIAGAAGLAAGGAAILKFASSGIEAFQTLAGEVKSFQRIAGGTTEDASRLVAAFKAMGIDAQTAAGGVFMLEKRLASGQANLKQFGVEVARDRKGNTDMATTLLNIADAYSKTADPAQRAALGAAAFGRQAVTLAPLLAKGREGIKDLYAEAERHGLILSADDLIRADELKVAMRNLKESVQGIEVSIGRALVPTVADVIGLIDKAILRAEELQKGPGTNAAGGWWDRFTTLLHEGQKQWDSLLGQLPTFATETENAGKSLAELAGETDTIEKALKGVVSADRALSTAHRGLAADQRSLADDTREYNKLLKQGAVDAEKVATAQRSLNEATRSVGHAQREQADAQRAYDQAAAAAAILGTDTANEKKQDAADKLADANDGVTSALERQTSAAAELAKQKAGDPEYQYKLADAKQKVADDTQSIADAEYDVGQKALAAADAHEAEAGALAGKADVIERLLADYDEMIAKNPEAAAALAPLIQGLGGPRTSITGFKPQPKGIAGPPQALYGSVTGYTPLPQGVQGPGSPLHGTTGVGGLYGSDSRTITINNNINTPMDPDTLARNILWGLN